MNENEAPAPSVSHPENREQRRRKARAAKAVAEELRRRGATALDVGIARVVVYAFGRDVVSVSTATIARRAAAWGVRGRWGGTPSYGAVTALLEWMRRIGWIAWPRAWVPRWHGRLPYAERPRLYPRKSARAGDAPRLPPRKFHALDWLRARLQGSSDRTAWSSAEGQDSERKICSSRARGAGAATPLRSNAESPPGRVDPATALATLRGYLDAPF